jgi:hypothetical protein
MHRTLSLAAALTFAFAASHAVAADAPKAKPAAKPAAEAPLTQGQLDVAPRVFVGKAACDSSQQVDISAVDGKPGHFKISFGKKTWVMTPEETTTGAVRLEDRKAGVVWLQIPAKSMLMDSKAGRRLVGGCQAAEQRTAGTPATTVASTN